MDGSLRVTPVAIRNGELLSGPSPLLLSTQGRGLLDGVRFHALAESPALDPEPLVRLALESLARSLAAQRRASITTALGQSLRGCHQGLLLANRDRPLAARVGAGVTCLALRDGEVYAAVAGPGLVYLADRQGARRLLPGQDAPHEPLGLTEPGPSPAMERHALGPGQALLACSSALERAAGYDGLRAILEASPAEAVSRLRSAVGPEGLFLAILVTAEGR